MQDINDQKIRLNRENAKWSREEEMQLIRNIAGGKSMQEIESIMQRKENALDLRLKKIIYDYVQKGKGIDDLSKYLKIPTDKLNQHYYSYKDMQDKKNVTENKTNEVNILNESKSVSINNILDDININNNNNNIIGGNIIPDNKSDILYDKIEEENKLMKMIVENNGLRREIKELFIQNKLSKIEKQLLKKHLKKNNKN